MADFIQRLKNAIERDNTGAGNNYVAGSNSGNGYRITPQDNAERLGQIQVAKELNRLAQQRASMLPTINKPSWSTANKLQQVPITKVVTDKNGNQKLWSNPFETQFAMTKEMQDRNNMRGNLAVQAYNIGIGADTSNISDDDMNALLNYYKGMDKVQKNNATVKRTSGVPVSYADEANAKYLSDRMNESEFYKMDNSQRVNWLRVNTRMTDAQIENFLNDEYVDGYGSVMNPQNIAGLEKRDFTPRTDGPLLDAGLYSRASAKIEDTLKNREFDKKYDQYNAKSDFPVKSRYNSANGYQDYTTKTGVEIRIPDYNTLSQDQKDALFYDAVNGNPRAIKALQYASNTYGDQIEVNPNVETFMTADEKHKFNYIYATEGKESAIEYYKGIEARLNQRYTENYNKMISDMSKDPAMAAEMSAYSVVSAPVTGLATLANMAKDLFTTGDIQRNDLKYTFLNQGQTMRAEVGNTIMNAAGGEGTFWGDVAKLGYDTSMSIFDNLYGMGTGRIVGNALGLTGKALNKTTEAVTLGIMGTTSASSSIVNNINSGMDTTSAIILGFGSGAIEVLTEKVGMDNLFDSVWRGKGAWTSWAKQVLSEGGEEILGSGMEDALGMVYDALTGYHASDFNREVDEYVLANNLTPNERHIAQEAVLQDHLKQMGIAGISGALSGGVMGAGASAIGAYQTASDTRNYIADLDKKLFDMPANTVIDTETVQGLIDEALSTETEKQQNFRTSGETLFNNLTGNEVESNLANTKAYNMAMQMQEKVDAGRAVTASEAKALYNELVKEQAKAEARSYVPEYTPEVRDKVIANDEAMANIIGENFTGTTANLFKQTIDNAKANGQNLFETAQAFNEVYRGEQNKTFTGVDTNVIPEVVQNNIRQAAVMDYVARNQQARAEVEAEIENENRADFEALADQYRTDGYATVGNIIQDNYKAGMDFEKFGNGIDAIVTGAENGVSLDNIELPANTNITNEVKNAVYNAAVKEVNNGREVSVSGVSGRNDVQNSGITRTGMAQETRRAQKERSISRQSERALERKNIRLTGEKVTTESLGFTNGTKGTQLNVIDLNSTEDTKEALQYARKYGYELTGVTGGFLTFKDGDFILRTRGVVEGKKIAAIADHKSIKFSQFVKHEVFHNYFNTDTKNRIENLLGKIEAVIGAENLDRITSDYLEIYDESGLSMDEVMIEMLCDMNGGMNFYAEHFADQLAKVDWYENVLEAASKVTQNALDNVDKVETTSEQNYSINFTDDNRPVIVVHDDISRYAKNDADLRKLVKKAISKFERVPINGQSIYFDKKTVGEYTYSKYTNKIENKDHQAFVDKMRIGTHPQDIVYATTDYINEAPNHDRKDDIVDFARGKILIDVDGRKYKAEVVIGFTDKMFCRMYDIVSMEPTSFDYKKRSTSLDLESKKDSVRKESASKTRISQNNDNNKQNHSIELNSDGDSLTKEQAEYFKDSKVRDKDGNLLVVYHGTPYGGFTQFKSRSGLNYFTADPKYAERYQNPSASSVRGYYNEATNPMTYKGYLNITNMFDISNKKMRDIYVNEYIKGGNAAGINPYISDAEINRIIKDGIDWTEADNLKEFFEDNDYEFDGILLNEGGDMDGTHRGNSYVTFNSNQFKNIDNENPTEDSDIRFSRELDTDYLELAKDPEANMDKLQEMVDAVAKEAFPNTKMVNDDGSLRMLYHGTNETGFNVFEDKYIGMSSGDDGFFGKGFYFAYNEGEARYYGSRRVIPAYLNLENPFNFAKEIYSYNGDKTNMGYAPDAIGLMKFAELFPDIASKNTIDVVNDGEYEYSSISITEFAKQLKNVIDNKEFQIQEIKNEFGETEYLSLADKVEGEYEIGGKVRKFVDYGFKQRWITKPNQLEMSYEYLAQNVYSHIDMHSFTRFILDNNDDFTNALKSKGYDGVIQSDNGDEAVAFSSSQIKDASPVTYDDNGNVIPLSERFNTKNDDIRYSRELEQYREKSYEELEATVEDLKERVINLEVDNKNLEFERNKWKKETHLSAHTKGSAAYNRQDTLIGKGSAAYIARGLIKRFGSTIKAEELVPDIQKWVTYLASHKDANTFSEVNEGILPIARKLIESAQEIVDNDGSKIKEYIRTTTIKISPSTVKDIQDYSAWYKSHFGKMRVSLNKGISVDDFCNELYQQFGSFMDLRDMTESDQIFAIADFVDNYAPVTQNPFSYNMAEAIQGAAFEVYNELLNAKVFKPTYADRSHATIDNLIRTNQQKINQIKLNARQETVRRVQEAKDHAKEVANAARMRRQDSDLRKQLLKLANRADKLKTNNANKAAIQALIGDIDLTAVRMTDGKAQNLQAFVAWADEQAANNPDFFINQREYGEAIRRLNSKKIGDMTIDDVKSLINSLRVLLNDISHENKLIRAEEGREVSQMAGEISADIENSRGMSGGIHGKFDNLIVKGSLSPVRFVHRLTGYVESDPLYRAVAGEDGLAGGQRKMLSYQQEAGDLFKRWLDDREFTKNITGTKAEVVTFDTKTFDGKPITLKMTKAMRMSLFLHSLNADSMRHMCGYWEKPSAEFPKGRYVPGGGFMLPNMDTYKKGRLAEAYAQGNQHVKIKKSELIRLFQGMSQKEIDFAYKMKEYFNGMSQKAINDVSEDLVGISLAEVKNYFPIVVSKNFLGADYGNIKMDGTIEGMGMLKERIVSSKPIDIMDATDVLKKSIESTSRYVGLAIPVRNVNKLLGVNFSRITEDGTFVGNEGSVLEDITNKWGNEAKSYIEKMINDLQAPGRNQEPLEKAIAKLRSGYAGAVLTWNLSVAMKQAASYPTAAGILGWGPLTKAMTQFGKVDLELIKKYTPLQAYRTKGFSTTELGDIQNQNKFFANLPKALNWIQGMDLVTTRKLWKASEIYIQENEKNLRVGSDAYYRAVANIYNQVIEETQPNYTALQRPEYLRSNSGIVQTLMMFKTQPMQNFNVLYDGIFNFKAKKAQFVNGAISKAEYHQAKTKLARAITSQIVQLVTFAAMTMLWNIFRRKEEKYKNENGEWDLAVMSKNMGKDIASGIAGMVPFGADVYELFMSVAFGDKYYGFESVTDSALSDLGNSVIKAQKMISEMIEDVKDGDLTFDHYKKNMKQVASSASKVFGIPFDNVANLIDALFEQTANGLGKITGNEDYAEYVVNRWKLNPDENTSKGIFTSNLYGMYKNEDEHYSEVRNFLAGRYGEDKLDEAMKERFTEDVSDNKTKGLYDDMYSKRGTAEYDKIYNDAVFFGYKEDTIAEGIRSAYARDVSGNPEATLYDAYANLLDLYRGNLKDYNAEYKKMLDLGFTDENIKKGVENILKEEQGVSKVGDLKERYYTPAQIEANKQKDAEKAAKQAQKEADKAAKKAEEDAQKHQSGSVTGSSWISGYQYDDGTLQVQENGVWYTYYNVPLDVFQGFLNADSKGRYVNNTLSAYR